MRFFLALGLLYDEPNSVDRAEKILLALCQGQDEAEIYCQKFRKWSVLTQWNECALAAIFRKGLSEALKDVMVGFPMPAGLNESMFLAIQIDRRLRERKAVHHLAVLSEHGPEPMQCDRTLTRAERQEHRRRNGLCFYCGDSTHAISDCPKRTKRFARSATIGTVQSKFLLSVTLICSLSSYSVMAFVDSGAALNLMDLEFARRCGFFLEPLQYPIPLREIDATPLAKNKPQYWTQLTMCMAPAHQGDIHFLVLHNLHDVVVLGLPWLQVHNPVLDWKSMSVSSWGCQGVHGDVPFLSISSSTPSEVPEFLSDYRDVFDEPKASALPHHRDCDCAINLIPGSKFPKGRLFNLSVPEHAAMRSYIKESLEKGHIRPSSSPLGAGFFFVAKKDGSLRPCIDYRLLNKITVKFQYPLPLLSDLFARIKGASWFTKIDLRGAYNLVRIKQGDEWKTAFNTPEGHFEYLVMPFGLSNAPSVFQSFMHDIFREYLDKFLIVYLDDILVFSDDWESHVKQVRMVFQVLRADSLFVKGSKCLFGVQKVSFLGFIFSPSTIEMDPVKVQAIYDWTQPTSVKSLQKFLGFANFYRRFIANFSTVAKPLTDLTKKGADVVNWSFAAVEAFQELKRRFSSAPVLCQPDVSLPFQVEVDASEIGAGAVLSQRGSDGSVMKPCAFFSRKFSPAERNYDVGNRQVESSDCPGVDTVVDRLQQIWTHVVDNLTLSQEKAQRFANRRRCVGPRLRVGDLVWLSSRYVPMKVSSPKFKPRFIGPYKISEPDVTDEETSEKEKDASDDKNPVQESREVSDPNITESQWSSEGNNHISVFDDLNEKEDAEDKAIVEVPAAEDSLVYTATPRTAFDDENSVSADKPLLAILIFCLACWKLWDAEGAPPHRESVRRVFLCPLHGLFVVFCADRKVTFPILCPNLAWCFGMNSKIPIYNLHDEEHQVAVYVCAHTAVIHDFTLNLQRHLQGHCSCISCLCVSEDRRWIVTGDQGPESLIIVWDSFSGIPVHTIFQSHPQQGVIAIAMSQNAKYLATIGGGTVQKYILFNPEDETQLITNSDTQVIFYSWDNCNLEYVAPPLNDKTFNKAVGAFSQSVFDFRNVRSLTATSAGKLVVWETTNPPLIRTKSPIKPHNKKALKLMHLQKDAITVLTTHDRLPVIRIRRDAPEFPPDDVAGGSHDRKELPARKPEEVL
ncbi:unnamed protein product [Ranitomeya imitator]|uniref:ribonuclease H n=1 Tax=Ranitomeya imitator TaxID=111125 RepID=A0ABN9M5X0_9NEOB|nr:unnamed protein product [Ranitomeya imitator]